MTKTIGFIDGGIKVGLSREVAKKLEIQTILGATHPAKDCDEHPAVLHDRITSPGGTTVSGLHVLERSGFNGIVMSMAEAADKRSMELGKR